MTILARRPMHTFGPSKMKMHPPWPPILFATVVVPLVRPLTQEEPSRPKWKHGTILPPAHAWDLSSCHGRAITEDVLVGGMGVVAACGASRRNDATDRDDSFRTIIRRRCSTIYDQEELVVAC
jgi:hypothetical protein